MEALRDLCMVFINYELTHWTEIKIALAILFMAFPILRRMYRVIVRIPDVGIPLTLNNKRVAEVAKVRADVKMRDIKSKVKKEAV